MSAAVVAGPGARDGDDIRRLYDRLDANGGVVERLSKVEGQIDKHEEVCAIRYKAIETQFVWVRWLLILLLVVSVLEPRQLIQAVLKNWGIEVAVTKADPALKPPRTP